MGEDHSERSDRRRAPEALKLVLKLGVDWSLRALDEGLSADLWTLHDHEDRCRAVAKLHRGFVSKVSAEANALAFAERAGLDGCPRLLARDERGFIATWLDDDAVGLDRADLSEEDLARLGRHLGHWLAALHATTVPRASALRFASDPLPWPERLRAQLNRLISRAMPDTSDGQLMAAARDWWLERLDACALPEYPGRLMHRDLRPANVIVSRGRFVGVVDFEQAGAGDPAWDMVKLSWWLLEPYPAIREPLRHAYSEMRPWPESPRRDLYACFEALGLLAYFRGGRHEAYCRGARRQLEALMAGESEPAWEG